LREEDHSREVAARIEAFRLANPFPVLPVTLVEAVELVQYGKPDAYDEPAMFDILRRYHITQLAWTCDAHYHYEDFDRFDDCQIVSVTIGNDIEVGNGFEALGLEELFPDDLEDGVVDTLEEAIDKIARARARNMTYRGKIECEDDPVRVTFDVPNRAIIVDAYVWEVEHRRLSFSVA
jgi:hypothetical protein